MLDIKFIRENADKTKEEAESGYKTCVGMDSFV